MAAPGARRHEITLSGDRVTVLMDGRAMRISTRDGVFRMGCTSVSPDAVRRLAEPCNRFRPLNPNELTVIQSGYHEPR